jgi:hypothetical protein
MIPLTPEQIEYKEKTLRQLVANLAYLEAKLDQESRPERVASLRNQFLDIQAHIERLQKELASGVVQESVADELCRRVAHALTKEKFYMARRYVNKLEAIEPFYPEIERLKREAETGHVSRRTRSIAQGTALPYGVIAIPTDLPERVEPRLLAASTETDVKVDLGPKRRFSELFQFHFIISCLVVLLILCVMSGLGGMTVLQWLIEGR